MKKALTVAAFIIVSGSAFAEYEGNSPEISNGVSMEAPGPIPYDTQAVELDPSDARNFELQNLDVQSEVSNDGVDAPDFAKVDHARDELNDVLNDATGNAFATPYPPSSDAFVDTGNSGEYQTLGLRPTQTVDIEDLPLKNDAIVSAP